MTKQVGSLSLRSSIIHGPQYWQIKAGEMHTQIDTRRMHIESIYSDCGLTARTGTSMRGVRAHVFGYNVCCTALHQ